MKSSLLMFLILLLSTSATLPASETDACFTPANYPLPAIVEACTVLLKQPGLVPDDKFHIHIVRGNALYRQDDLNPAIADFTAAIALRPKAKDGWKYRAIAYALHGDIALAEKDDRAALAIDPDDAVILAHSCSVHAGLKQFDAAMADCSKSISINPRNSTVFDARALIYAEKGDYPSAIKDYDTALSINPRNAFALLSRSIAKRHIGDTAGREADLAAARKLDPAIEKSLGP